MFSAVFDIFSFVKGGTGLGKGFARLACLFVNWTVQNFEDG